MKEVVVEIIKYFFIFILGAGGLEIWKMYRGKKKESIEVANAFLEGQTMEVQFKTDLNKLVDQSIAPLKDKIKELEETIITNATKYHSDSKNYIARMADLEQKLDDQTARNQHLESRLEQEMTLKESYLSQLAILKNRVAELEALKPK